MLKFLLIIVLIGYVLFKFSGAIIRTFALIFGASNHQRFGDRGHSNHAKPGNEPGKKSKTDDIGEYVDYEEVKD